MATPVRPPRTTVRVSLRDQIRAERAQAVLAVARELFYEKGFDDATTLEIAVRAGVGVGTLFKCFPTKDALLFAVVNADLAKQHRRAAQQAKSEVGLLARLLLFYGQILDFHVDNAVISRPFLRLLITPDIQGAQSPLDLAPDLAIQATTDFVAEAVAAGELKPDVRVDDLTDNCLSIFLNVLNRTLINPSIDSPHETLGRRLALQVTPLFAATP